MNKMSKKLRDDLLSSELTAKDKDKIKEKLLKEAKKQGTKVFKEDRFPNAAYTGNGKNLKKLITKLLKKTPKEQRGQIVDQLDEATGGVIKHLGKDRIVLGEGNLSEADILSHELGHSKYSKKGRSNNIIAKTAHKLMIPSKLISNNFGGGLGAIYGFNNGRKQIKKKEKGEKISIWDKSKSAIVPTLAVSPLLIAEGAASLKGLKMMKNAGASKELLKQSRKRLASAFGTYVGQSAKPVIGGVIGNEAGKIYERKKNKKD